jgi:hypothetical protein
MAQTDRPDKPSGLMAGPALNPDWRDTAAITSVALPALKPSQPRSSRNVTPVTARLDADLVLAERPVAT